MDEKDFAQILKDAFFPLFSNIDIRLDRIENDIKEVKSKINSIESRTDFMETDVKDTKYKVVDVLNDLINISSDTRKTKLIIENEIRPVIRISRNEHVVIEEKTQELPKKTDVDDDTAAHALKVFKNLNLS